MRKVVFTLTPAASKRLIAKAVVQLPEVQHALKHGRLIIAGGTTNGYIVEEITGQEFDKWRYTSGIVTESSWCLTPPEERMKPLVFEKGLPSSRSIPEVLADFARDDVFIKGGNALDLEGTVGILVGGKNSGTIGSAYGQIVAIGAYLILPVGLEKLIPSVTEAANALGQQEIDESFGMACGLFPVTYGSVVTELDAISILYGLESMHVHSGGVGGSEGAVGLLAYGEDSACDNLMQDLEVIRCEPPTGGSKRICSVCGSCLNGRK
ncbi:MAG: hypothetical protein FD169_1910 [Bacillota bacterium]|nr:MAG: hypothetical protein FD169_1910 [Bacillota bacterium]MBS3950062.1 hypothetical protein [Peptococcaceae bacterium]